MKTILLADDSITIQKVVELTFSDADYKVVCVSSGTQALKKLSEIRPDVILLDVIMPEKNGYEVCEQLKRSPSTSGIPVLLLTGTFEPFDKKRADTAGANGHLTKPFESQALIAKVEELIASTPSVAADEQGGQMDIISGGEVYHVDPGRAAEGMRPVLPSVAPSAQTTAPGPGAAEPSPSTFAGGAGRSFAPFEGEEKETEPRTHPALASPDPAAGGSYVGFADVGLDRGMEGSIVPDRFEETVGGGAAGSTTRLRRESVVPGRDVNSSGAPGFAPDASRGAEDSFGGSFEAEFNLVDEVAPGSPTADALTDPAEIPSWTPPPEAPPAETWQVIDEPAESLPPPAVPRQVEKATIGDGKGLGLTPEMIDLIAEKVVQRLSDRVVREIAWEVVPGVAESLVRRRIKDLEEG